GAPAIVALRRHLSLTPLAVVLAAPAQPHPERVVSVGEAIGLDGQRFAADALDREAAAADRRTHAVDHCARTAGGSRAGLAGARRVGGSAFSHWRPPSGSRWPVAAASA